MHRKIAVVLGHLRGHPIRSQCFVESWIQRKQLLSVTSIPSFLRKIDLYPYSFCPDLVSITWHALTRQIANTGTVIIHIRLTGKPVSQYVWTLQSQLFVSFTVILMLFFILAGLWITKGGLAFRYYSFTVKSEEVSTILLTCKSTIDPISRLLLFVSIDYSEVNQIEQIQAFVYY